MLTQLPFYRKNKMEDISISIECVDNAKEFPGMIVYDDKTFPNPSQQVDGVNVMVNNTLPHQETDFGAKHGPHSSARPFKLPLFRLDEECDQPDLK